MEDREARLPLSAEYGRIPTTRTHLLRLFDDSRYERATRGRAGLGCARVRLAAITCRLGSW